MELSDNLNQCSDVSAPRTVTSKTLDIVLGNIIQVEDEGGNPQEAKTVYASVEVHEQESLLRNRHVLPILAVS